MLNHEDRYLPGEEWLLNTPLKELQILTGDALNVVGCNGFASSIRAHL